jgi:hypothetical protein
MTMHGMIETNKPENNDKPAQEADVDPDVVARMEQGYEQMNKILGTAQDEQFVYDGEAMGEDYCKRALKQADSEEEIKAAMDRLIAEGDDGQDKVLAGALFTLRSRAKLSLHQRTMEHAAEILVQKHYDHKNGSLIAYGESSKGYMEVVLSTLVPLEFRDNAEFLVTTGY